MVLFNSRSQNPKHYFRMQMLLKRKKGKKKRIKTKSLAFDHNQQHLLSIWKHSTSPYIHLKLLNTAEQRMKNTTERTGLWPNCFGKRCSVERSVKQADSTEETRVSLTLILGKTTEHIRKGTLRQCTSAPPYPLTWWSCWPRKASVRKRQEVFGLNKVFSKCLKDIYEQDEEIQVVYKGVKGVLSPPHAHSWGVLIIGCQPRQRLLTEMTQVCFSWPFH